MNYQNYLAGIGLAASILGTALNLQTTQILPGASGTTSSPTIVSSASPSPSPVVVPSPSPVIKPGEQQRILWGYSYAPAVVPDLSYLKLEPGKTYWLIDRDGRCIGKLTPKGDTRWHNTLLIHRYPNICGE